MKLIKSIYILTIILLLAVLPMASKRADAAALTPTYHSSFGSYGQQNGQMRNPRAVAANPANGYIYVTDYFNRRVAVFNSAGEWQFNFGTQGSGNGQLDLPTDIAISNDGSKVYVLDYFNNRVEIFNSNGVYQAQIAPSGLGYPLAITLNSDSTRLAVHWKGDSPDNLNLVKIYNTSNNLEVSSWSSASTITSPFIVPTGITYTPDDSSLLISDPDNSVVRFFSATGSPVAPSQMGSAGSGESQFVGVSDIVISPGGEHFLVTDSDNGRIQVFNLATQVFESQIGVGGEGSGDNQFDNPSGMTFSPDGSRLYIVDTDNARVKIYDIDYPSGDGGLTDGSGEGPDENTPTPKPPKTGALLGAGLVSMSIIVLIILTAQQMGEKHLDKERVGKKFH